jgi:hypothetical protein
VVSFGARKLSLYAGDTGDLLVSKGICYTFREAFGFVGRRTGVLVCEDGIKVFDFPGLTYRGVRSLPGKARTAAFGNRRVAVGFAEGPVRVYDARDWSQAGHFALGERASALALSPDERTLAVALRDGRLAVLDLATSTRRSLSNPAKAPVRVLAYAADGGRLVGAAGSSVTLWQAATPEPTRSFAVAGAVADVRWISGDAIVVVGRSFSSAIRVADGAAEGLPVQAGAHAKGWVDAAVTRDGRMLCIASAERSIHCLARGRPPARGDGVDAAPTQPGVPPRHGVTAGRLVGHTGNHLTMEAHPHTELPRVGRRAELRRHVLREQGGLLTSEWPPVAFVTVDRVHRGRLRLTIEEDRSATVLPDSEKDPFEYDAPVRLVWAR